jgi:CheY-like chemotaxis protein
MTVTLGAPPGMHGVQFYESEPFLHRAIVTFFAGALGSGDPIVMIARRRTYQAVAGLLASGCDGAPVDVGGRITFVDADEALETFMDGGMPDPLRFGQTFGSLLEQVRSTSDTGTIWIYGEMVDVLCRRGNHAAAVLLEELWNSPSAKNRTSVLCGYAIESFDDDVNASQLRQVCRQHSHVIPTEGFTNAPDERTRLEHVALLQQRSRALERVLAHEPAPDASSGPAGATVYVIDDDVSVRRSLARLLGSVALKVRTFESAETFLAEVDESSAGCLIVDVQLLGMSGAELQARLAAEGRQLPIIAMSGAHDAQVEADMLHRGATAFLRKPFDAQTLIDAIARALS